MGEGRAKASPSGGRWEASPDGQWVAGEGRCAAPLWPSIGAALPVWERPLCRRPPLPVWPGVRSLPVWCGQKWPGRGTATPPLRVWPVGSGSPGLEVICDTGHGVALKEGGPPDVAS